MSPYRFGFEPLFLVLMVVAALLYWRGPDWRAVGDAFTYVRWDLVAAAIGWSPVVIRMIGRDM